MAELVAVLVLTILAGAAVPAGAMVARFERLPKGHAREDFLHGIMAFGGGVLVAAVALVLIPEGIHLSTTGNVPILVMLGAVIFLFLDRAVHESGAKGANVLALIMDYVPESIALGAAFSVGGPTGPLLAFLIGVQNFPEGFNAYRELVEEGGMARKRAMLLLWSVVPLGPIAGVMGFFFLAGQPVALGALYLFASGGILFLVFHDILPLAHRNCHYHPTLGGVLGFLVGLMGQVLIGG